MVSSINLVPSQSSASILTPDSLRRDLNKHQRDIDAILDQHEMLIQNQNHFEAILSAQQKQLADMQKKELEILEEYRIRSKNIPLTSFELAGLERYTQTI